MTDAKVSNYMLTRPQSRRNFMAMVGITTLGASACSTLPAPQPVDLIIKGGRVIDPASGIDATLDVGIANGVVVSVAPAIAVGGAKLLDASGKLVVPGLIDIHTHATVDPASPALILADGVTSWIETGWQGAYTVDSGIAAVKAAPQTAGLLLNMGRNGVVMGAGDTADLELADVGAARAAIAANRKYVVGVKVRLSRNITGEHDLEVLRRAQQVTESFGIPVMVHIGDTFTPLGDLLDAMKPGDIVTHMYSPPPHAIVDEGGRIIPQAIAARKRGVIFDWGQGTRQHVLWSVAQQAIEQGFLPDTISTDWTVGGHDLGMVGMPTVMSNVLSLGVPLNQVVAMATANAARVFPLFKGRGTLQPGAPADVAVLELRDGEFELVDTQGNKRIASQKLFATDTVLGGKLIAPTA